MTKTAAKAVPAMPVDDQDVVETFVTSFLPSFTDGHTLTLTMAVDRLVPERTGHRLTRVVASRLVMPLKTARDLRDELDGMIERQTSGQPPATKPMN